MLRLRWWLFLRRRVTGRLKLRGDLQGLSIHPSFRCDGDLWLGIHSAEGRIIIGEHVSASGPLVITAVKPLIVGPGVLFGPNVLVTDHYHGDVGRTDHRAMRPADRPLHAPGSILIEQNAQCGANSVILSPARIGEGAVIGANAVVKGEVPALAVHVGLGRAKPTSAI